MGKCCLFFGYEDDGCCIGGGFGGTYSGNSDESAALDVKLNFWRVTNHLRV